MSRPIRVMLFYDGNYFRQGQVYFRYSEERGWFSLSELHSLLEKYVAVRTKAPVEITKLVAAHYYDGRPTTRVADESQLVRDRNFELALMAAGVVPHYLALSEKLRPGTEEDPEYRLAQKGVDVQLALDVLDLAHEDRLDVVVLLTGDGDFVPLVRKVTSLGKQVVIAHFEIQPWTDTRGLHHRGTFVARALADAASWSLNFNLLVKDQDWKTEVKSLFFMPKGAREEQT